MMLRSEYLGQLEDLKTYVGRLGDLAAASARASVLALSGDAGAAAGVEAGIAGADRLEDGIERSCLDMLLRQQPVADDLRLVSSAFRVVGDLTRVCEMSAGVCGLLDELEGRDLPGDVLEDVRAMGEQAAAMCERAVVAWLGGDEAAGRAVAAMDAGQDERYAGVRRACVGYVKDDSYDAGALFTLAMTAKYYERMADRATRVAAWAIFRETGVAHEAGRA
jgi:phosphate transport system protein